LISLLPILLEENHDARQREARKRMIKRGRPKGSKNRLKTTEDDENVVRYLLRYLRRLDEAFEQVGELTAQMTSIIRQLDRIEKNRLSRAQETPPNRMARRRDRDTRPRRRGDRVIVVSGGA
jgi:DNA invertase Pin-like site-specific DNA recombinase